MRQLASIGATQLDVARAFGLSLSTVERRLTQPEYRQAWDEGQGGFDLSLRRKQADKALQGNVTMLIWLGKQRLGQRDNLEVTGQGGAPLQAPVQHNEIIQIVMVAMAAAPPEQKAALAAKLLELEPVHEPGA